MTFLSFILATLFWIFLIIFVISGFLVAVYSAMYGIQSFIRSAYRYFLLFPIFSAIGMWAVW